MASQRSKRHHVLPKFIIRRFADADTNLVVAYDRWNGPPPRERAPKSVAYEWDYFTFESQDPEKATSIEDQALVVPDDRGAKLLGSIARHLVVTQDEVPATRELLALLHMRSPEYRELAEEAVDHGNAWYAQADDQGWSDVQAAGDPPVGDMGGAVGQLLGRNEVLRLQMGREPVLLRILERPEWSFRVVWLPYAGFVTSDNPIIAKHRDSGSVGRIRSIGLQHARELELELWLLFDPHCALLVAAHSRLPPLVIDLPQHELRQINTAVASASDRWTIWQPGSPADQFLDLPKTRTVRGRHR